MDTLSLNQSLWQFIDSKHKLDNELIYQKDYIKLSAEINTLFGIDKKEECFIYLLNFSMS